MRIIKSNTYNIINPEPFDIPFPLSFELLSGNTLLAQYDVSESGQVNYSFNPNTSIKILTSTRRALTLNDIYFLFISRVFPDKTPYTAIEMERFEIYEYQPYVVIRKTRGMLPGDKYWFRFEGEDVNYKVALNEYIGYYERSYKRQMQAFEEAKQAQLAAESELQEAAAAALKAAEQGDHEAADMIMTSVGIKTRDEKVADVMKSQSEAVAEVAEVAEIIEVPSVPEVSEVAEAVEVSEVVEVAKAVEVAEVVEAEPSAEPTGGMMSEEEIAALLAFSQAAAEPEPEPTAEPEPAPTSNEKMSDDAIAAMFAQMQAEPSAEPEPEPTPEPEPEPASNEKMSDDAIAAMFAQMQAEPAAEPAAEPEPEPTAEPEPAPASNEKMSDDAIAALFAQNS